MSNRRFPILLALCGALSLPSCGGDDEPALIPGPVHARVMSFNVLCSFCDESYEPWDTRVAYIADTVKRHDPDLIGFQEFLTGDEVRQVAALTPGYGTVFLVDPEAPLFEEYADALIFYRTSKFELLRKGFYFLSDTPDDYWSVGWAGSQFWRLVAWVQLRQRADGREFYFATTHVDNNTPNQERSAPVILERTAPWAERMPALVVGDFNSKPDSQAYRILTEGVTPGGFRLFDTHDVAETLESVHNLATPPPYDPATRIDHIFVASPEPWACARWAVDQTVYGPGPKEASDHLAIVATVTLE
jgi:endonuclease/exonuclease/phosphatase family metal-dependent hydrolase